MSQPNKAWKKQSTLINSNPDLISMVHDGNDSLPIQKTDVPIKKTTGPLTSVNQNIGNNSNSLQADESMNNLNLNNNQFSGGYGGNYNSPYGNIFGGGGYSGGSMYGGGMYGGGYGSMGSMYGGGGMYGGGMYGGGGYGSMYNGRGNQISENTDFLEKCFFTIERMNFQIFHLCELARMIHQQSTALAYLYDIIKKGYILVNTYFKDKTLSVISTIKTIIKEKILSIRMQIKEFLSKSSELENSKIRRHIKVIDNILFILLIIASSTVLYKAVKVK